MDEESGQLSLLKKSGYSGGIPVPKIHCVCLAKRTLEQTVEQYRKAKSKR